MMITISICFLLMGIMGGFVSGIMYSLDIIERKEITNEI